jgi:tetratricopeptide (TPR) repeat protein
MYDNLVLSRHPIGGDWPVARHKKKPRHFTGVPATAWRVDKALREHRTQQALDLARMLYKQEPSPQHKELLKHATLARARDLAGQGKTRDAGDLFNNAALLDNSPVFLAEIGQDLARTGHISKALQLLPHITDPQAHGKILAHIADEAVRLGDAGRGQLPEDLRGQFDLVLQAFTAAEAGRDDEAREKLNGIGLRSPFLEWKLLLRGLLAYYSNDDARVLENWQRLDATRLPFRVAAPLRFTLDRAFVTSQPPEAQQALQRQADRLLNSPLIQQLRMLQAAIAQERQLPGAFRQAEQLLPLLRSQAPQLVPRLASCFYWAIVHHGQPEDLRRYERAFGKPAEDPSLARLEALATEMRGEFDEAHRQWQRFDKSVTDSSAWPADQKSAVRALIWAHMGRNADIQPDMNDAELPPFLRGAANRPRPLKPTAEQCYERSLELAPDQRSTYEALLDHFLHQEDNKNAEKAARRLLERFPDNVPTLEKLGDLLMQDERHGEALELYQRALHANPLEHRLRSKVATAYSYSARGLVEAGRFDDARAAYQAAMVLDDRSERYSILCKLAACEYKADNAERAEELLQEAQSEQGNRLAVVFTILIETIRFGLSKLKTRFNNEFNALLAEPPTGAAAVVLAETAAAHRAAGVKYHGQQTHEKKVLTYLDNARKAEFTEAQLLRITAALANLKKPRLHEDYIHLAQHRFPNNPQFYIAEAIYYLGLGSYRANPYHVTRLLQKARELAQALPRGDRQQETLKLIQDCEQRLQEMNPFRMFGNLMDSMPFDIFGGPDEEFYDDEEYDDPYF